MGACYSKHINSNDNKQGPTKSFGSKRSRKKYDNLLPETALLKTDANVDGLISSGDKSLPFDSTKEYQSYSVSRSSTPDLIPDDTSIKKVDGCVVPSDSGIESIGIAPEEIQEHTNKDQNELTKKLERLSRGSCAKCGNFRLDDSAFTALLADTYCSCGPRLQGRSSINLYCRTHGQKRQLCYIGSDQNSSGSTEGQNAKSVQISEKSEETVPSAINIVELDDLFQAPLAHFDSLDILNSSAQMKQKRRSLLSEILNITDSICRCDFYSNEYFCSQNKDIGDVNNFRSHFNENNCSVSLSEDTPSKHHTSSHDVNNFESHYDGNNCSVSLSEGNSSKHHSSSQTASEDPVNNPVQPLSNLILPSKKSTSLPKNVSFAAHSSVDLATKPVESRLSGELNCCLSETSSGVFTHTSISDPFLRKLSLKGKRKQTLSLDSRTVLPSDSSSEMLNNCTDEDLVSLDLDSVMSLSHSSLKYLTESSEDLLSSLGGISRMMLDGVDCLIIPHEVYHQIQIDLSNLKQQLGCLTAIIQENTEEE